MFCCFQIRQTFHLKNSFLFGAGNNRDRDVPNRAMMKLEFGSKVAWLGGLTLEKSCMTYPNLEKLQSDTVM